MVPSFRITNQLRLSSYSKPKVLLASYQLGGPEPAGDFSLKGTVSRGLICCGNSALHTPSYLPAMTETV